MYENIKICSYCNIKIYKYGNIQIYMQKNINMKNVKKYVKKVNMYIKIYNVTSNRSVKPNKGKICKSNKYICVEKYI